MSALPTLALGAAAITVALIFVIRDAVRPVVVAVVSGLIGHATKYATGYAFGMLLATAASLQELAAIATDNHWTYVAAAAKVLQPGLVAVIAYIRPAPAPAPAQQNQPPADLGKGGTP